MLYVHTYHPGLFPFDETALFDILDDGHQTTNLAAGHPGIVDELDQVLQDWLGESLPPEGDPMTAIIESGPWRYVRPDPWIARLRSRGREADAIANRLDAASYVGNRR